MILTSRHYRTGQPVDVHIVSDRIAAIVPSDAATAGLPWIAPGLIDIQVNGFGGIDWDSESNNPDRWRQAVQVMLSHGVTTFLPTFCTNSRDGFIRALELYRSLLDDAMMAHMLPGVHIEGPYISDLDGPRGAHNREYTRDPDAEEIEALIEACGNRLKILTLAPERNGAIQTIRELTRRGVVVSVAHTAASPEQLDAAIRAGARFSTHLGNGAHPMINRHRNYFYDQLADDRLWASVIPDGHHVPRALFNILLRSKGLERIVLTSDSAAPAGMPPGIYGGSELLPTGRLQTRENPAILAGSAIALDFGVGKACEMAGLSLAQSIDLATAQPARLVGLADRGRLENGAVADLIVFDWDAANCSMTVRQTYVQGEKVVG